MKIIHRDGDVITQEEDEIVEINQKIIKYGNKNIIDAIYYLVNTN